MSFLYFIMNCQLIIGTNIFDSITSANVSSSFKELSDTATIVLPRNYRQANIKGKVDTLERKKITDLIKVGDKVELLLGYNEDLKTVFKGYVKKISADIPLQIECEDEMFNLRKSTFTESFQNINLIDLLKKIAPNYEHEVIDNIPLGKFIISNASAYEVLEALRKDYLLHSYFNDQKLIVAFPTDIKPQYNYTILTQRMRSSEALEFIRAEDVKIQIKAISNNSDGTKEIVTVGDSDGSTRTLNFANKTKSELENLAKKNLESLKFDGFEGSFELFGQPLIRVGDAVTIMNEEFKDQEGKYLIESVEIDFSKDGYKQIVKPSLSL